VAVDAEHVTEWLELAAVVLAVVAAAVAAFWLGAAAGLLPATALSALAASLGCGAASWALHGAPGASRLRFRRPRRQPTVALMCVHMEPAGKCPICYGRDAT
jgi:hypothetical protein